MAVTPSAVAVEGIGFGPLAVATLGFLGAFGADSDRLLTTGTITISTAIMATIEAMPMIEGEIVISFATVGATGSHCPTAATIYVGTPIVASVEASTHIAVTIEVEEG